MSKLTVEGLDAVMSQVSDDATQHPSGSEEAIAAAKANWPQPDLMEIYENSQMLKDYVAGAFSQVLLCTPFGQGEKVLDAIVRGSICFGVMWERNRVQAEEFAKMMGDIQPEKADVK